MSKNKKNENSIRLLDHEYDGIREYDQHLPNWWLFTLYGAIVFSVANWFFYFQTNPFDTDVTRLHAEMKVLQNAQTAASLKMLNDEVLWKQSRNPDFVEAGRATFTTTCVPCHGAQLLGGIGPNLTDKVWIHGGRPTQMFNTIVKGAYAPTGEPTAMQAWGPILGSRKIAELVAFILSHHDTIEIQPAETSVPAQ